MKHQIHINGTTFNVEEAGQGQAILLLHAGIADSRMWDPQFHWLSQSYRTIRFDFRGYGESPLVPGAFSSAADAFGILDALDVDHALLIGCSMGGAAAIRMAGLHPDCVDGLVLVGPALHGYDAQS